MVVQSTPNALVGVRFLHRPQKFKRRNINFFEWFFLRGDGGIERRRLSSRVGVERFFIRKILVTESVITVPQIALLAWRNRRAFRFSVPTETKRYTVLVEEDILHARRWRNRKPDRDGGRQGRVNFHQKIMLDRKCCTSRLNVP